MKIEVILLDKEAKKFEKAVRQSSRRLARLFQRSGITVEVYLINDKRIRQLNKRFRSKNQPTNVLSFQKPKNFPGTKLGEVFLDPIYIERQKEDLSLMLVHGVLHILGYDHEKKSDRMKMEKMEQRLLQKLVIGK